MPSKNFVAFDPLTILSRLRDVEYMVVGGFAAVLYGAPTITGDLDIMPRADEENIGRLAGVLATLHTVVREPRSSGRRIEVTVDLLKQAAKGARLGGQLRTRTAAGPKDVFRTTKLRPSMPAPIESGCFPSSSTSNGSTAASPDAARAAPACASIHAKISGTAHSHPQYTSSGWSNLMSTEFLGTRKLCAESKAFVSAGVDPLSDEFRQDGVALATQEKMREGVTQRQRGDHF